MFCGLDVFYRENSTVTACALFSAWTDAQPSSEKILISEGAANDYQPGEFYRRELPYILAALATLQTAPAIVIIDGYVWLGAERPGLGAHLFTALAQRAAVVGVAKRPFVGATAVPVLRGDSRQPLFVSAVGISIEVAVDGVRNMHGPHRIPTLLKRVDRLSREGRIA